MKNSDVSLVVLNANILCSIEKIPFKIARRAKDLSKVSEVIILKLKEITELGNERIEKLEVDHNVKDGEKQSDEFLESLGSLYQEIEAERKEFLEKEVSTPFDKCPIAWFDDVPNVEIPYKYMDDEEQKLANSHAIIDLLIEKGFIV